ncbi:MAG TPA: pantoate--beta-alanine ligase [Chryseolinea sp.]|nr:pantoate--beta-alanine ligase [Chryseolinea sp.]
MEIFKQIAPLRTFLDSLRKPDKSIGLVPTMGALHQGHISLIHTSKSQNAITVATIYVNPTQFNNPNDLQKYPKTPEKDLEMLQKAGCDVVFSPDDQEMYEDMPRMKFDFGHLDKVMEGEFRPGHFSGVALIVSKLFNIIQPDRAYFGQKDWQQFAVIRQLVRELKFNFELQSVPILRESDGLAMSSRNLRLSQAQRFNASVFHQALTMAKNALISGAELETVKKAVSDMVNSKPEIKLEYFELADSKNLTILNNVDKAVLPILCIAGYAGDIRLIDNMFLD